jgi:hypothetical protein
MPGKSAPKSHSPNAAMDAGGSWPPRRASAYLCDWAVGSGKKRANLSKALPRCDTGTLAPPQGPQTHPTVQVGYGVHVLAAGRGRQQAPVGHPSTARAGPGPARAQLAK